MESNSYLAPRFLEGVLVKRFKEYQRVKYSIIRPQSDKMNCLRKIATKITIIMNIFVCVASNISRRKLCSGFAKRECYLQATSQYIHSGHALIIIFLFSCISISQALCSGQQLAVWRLSKHETLL